MSKLVHVGIAVKDMDDALSFFQNTLGLQKLYRQAVPRMKMEIAGLSTGESELELLCPQDPDTPVGKFLSNRGEGIHHICLEVEDLDAKLAELAGKGVELVDKVPRIGGRGHRIAFLHPGSTHGVLIEYYERKKE